MRLKLQTRILLILLLITSVLGLTTIAAHHYVLLPKFIDLEKQHIQSNLNRVSRAIINELGHLESLTSDWSSWNDTYRYVVDYNIEYEISKLTIPTLVNNNLNLLVILDNQGLKVWGNVIDEDYQKSIVAKPFDQNRFSDSLSLLQQDKNLPLGQQVKSGLVATSAGLMLCAARPIIDSNEKGPSHGTVILGRFLKNRMIDKISKTTEVPFSIDNFFEKEKALKPGALSVLQNATEINFETTDDNIKATKLFRDLTTKKPIMAIHITEERELLTKGVQVLKKSMLWIFCGVTTSLAFLMFMLKISVVKPLQNITENIVTSRRSEQSVRVKALSTVATPEVFLLAKEFNSLMETLDVKNEKLTEAHFNLMREAKKLKEAENFLKNLDKLKNEFISTAAHELRTPIASIIGYTELISNENEWNFTSEQRTDFHREILENSERLAKIIDDILDVSRIESGQRIPLNKELVSIEELISKSVKRHKLQTKRDISLSISPGLPEKVEIDGHRITQVMDNLLSNAIKYSPKESPISVRLGQSEQFCDISVADQGIGMSKEQREKIFEKFYRVDTSNTAASGLGLGMSIVKQIIEDHGGAINIESAINKGTKVNFTLSTGA